METEKTGMEKVVDLLEAIRKSSPAAFQDLLQRSVELDAKCEADVFVTDGKNGKVRLSVIGLLNGIVTKLNGETERLALIVDETSECVGVTKIKSN